MPKMFVMSELEQEQRAAATTVALRQLAGRAFISLSCGACGDRLTSITNTDAQGEPLCEDCASE